MIAGAHIVLPPEAAIFSWVHKTIIVFITRSQVGVPGRRRFIEERLHEIDNVGSVFKVANIDLLLVESHRHS